MPSLRLSAWRHEPPRRRHVGRLLIWAYADDRPTFIALLHDLIECGERNGGATRRRSTVVVEEREFGDPIAETVEY